MYISNFLSLLGHPDSVPKIEPLISSPPTMMLGEVGEEALSPSQHQQHQLELGAGAARDSSADDIDMADVTLSSE